VTDSVKSSIDIDATAEEIFELATDFETYPEWNSAIRQVKVTERDDQGRAIKVWMEVDAKLKVVTYTLGYDYSEAPEAFSWSLLEGDVKQLDGSYRFDEFGDVTDVTYEMAVDPGFPIPSFLKRQGERQVVKSALEGLKKRVESRT
jgi:uncharacterized membrane protein